VKILGVHFNTHESGAAVLDGGVIVSAISQERRDRQKMSDAAPIEAADAALACGVQKGPTPRNETPSAVLFPLAATGYGEILPPHAPDRSAQQ
jgi:hypothetical protein